MRPALVASLLLLAAGCKPGANPTTGTPSTGAGSSGGVTAPAATPTAAAPDTVVATWTGGKLSYGEVETTVKGRLTRMDMDYLTERHQLLSGAIDDSINKALLQAEAKRRGLADEAALIKVEVEEKNSTVTEEEMTAFYEANKRRFRNKPMEEIRDQVQARAADEKKRKAMTAFIEDLRKKANVQVTLAAPDLPRLEVGVGDNVVRGNPKAKITVVEFADYQCPYCTRGYQSMKEVMASYGDQVAWVFRDFPLSFHQRATPASLAANCAGAQGKYWEMHDWLFENQKTLEDADLERGAQAIGLNLDLWKTCLTDPKQAEEIQKDMADGQALGVTGTPAYFINGIMLSGARPVEDFKAAIDKELAATK